MNKLPLTRKQLILLGGVVVLSAVLPFVSSLVSKRQVVNQRAAVSGSGAIKVTLTNQAGDKPAGIAFPVEVELENVTAGDKSLNSGELTIAFNAADFQVASSSLVCGTNFAIKFPTTAVNNTTGKIDLACGTLSSYVLAAGGKVKLGGFALEPKAGVSGSKQVAFEAVLVNSSTEGGDLSDGGTAATYTIVGSNPSCSSFTTYQTCPSPRCVWYPLAQNNTVCGKCASEGTPVDTVCPLPTATATLTPTVTNRPTATPTATNSPVNCLVLGQSQCEQNSGWCSWYSVRPGTTVVCGKCIGTTDSPYEVCPGPTVTSTPTPTGGVSPRPTATPTALPACSGVTGRVGIEAGVFLDTDNDGIKDANESFVAGASGSGWSITINPPCGSQTTVSTSWGGYWGNSTSKTYPAGWYYLVLTPKVGYSMTVPSSYLINKYLPDGSAGVFYFPVRVGGPSLTPTATPPASQQRCTGICRPVTPESPTCGSWGGSDMAGKCDDPAALCCTIPGQPTSTPVPLACPLGISGDLNCSGVIDCADWNLMKTVLGKSTTPFMTSPLPAGFLSSPDLSPVGGTGIVNVFDVEKLRRNLTTVCN